MGINLYLRCCKLVEISKIMKNNTAIVRKSKLDALLRKHPWVFSGAIESETQDFEDGCTIDLITRNQQFLARGHFQPGSIAVRILTFNEQERINQDFWNKKIKNAVDIRYTLGLLSEKNQICRLIHGEGDNLPGLIIDYYAGVAVVQSHSTGMFLAEEQICTALQNALGDHLIAVYSKSKETLPNRVDAENKYLFGETTVPHIAKENGIPFSVNWITGQKTGFFIDQRENRALLAKYSAGKKVLNTFCYSGGFSMYALEAGAKEVHSLDSSEKAITLVEQNLALIKNNKNHTSIKADAVKHMNDVETDYDVIILDPPAFAKHRDKRHKAIKAYTRLNANAIRQIKPGGIIFTFSCSQVVDKFLFNKSVIAAAIECKRNVRILEQLHQPADHPINAFHPEGEYLKGLVIQVD